MFIDEVRVFAQGGHGGRGCVAFQREMFRPKGGPSGGNGGHGGSVILEADPGINNLIAQFYQPRLIAARGRHGMGKGMDGHAGADLVVKVPCGTLVWTLPDRMPPPEAPAAGPHPTAALPLSTARRSPFPASIRPVPEAAPAGRPDFRSPPKASGGQIVADLTQPGQRFVLCKGGRGGLGNRNFATSRRQAPRFAQPGEPGDEGHFLFELRMMADVGLVGFPNAGKSTLLGAISRARPRIAPYPFTTLHPQVGIVEYADFRRITVCDVPGLLEGAHRNIGLGHAFLRHIQRCRMLVILLDMAGADGRSPWDDYRCLLRELEIFDPELVAKPRLLAANKIDEPIAATHLRRFKRRVPRTPVLSISAAFGQGLPDLLEAIRRIIDAPPST
ncbi:MAG: GTPase ObgE [Verrucomicrobia bacterium]|nr:GTPase ObgE [Verrucomicrobiota bacterium]